MSEPRIPPVPPEDEEPPPLPPPAESPAELIETREALGRLSEHVADCERVALDTEANSMHAYRERTCIVQITAAGKNAIIDVLAVEDLSPLRAALDQDTVELIVHGGDYDITVLTRDHDFRFHRVFDTMIAATLLGEPKVGLADLVHLHFGHRLDKRFQRADWARRPLDEQQLDYLQRDTLYLPALQEHLSRRLAEEDLQEEVAIEFTRLAGRKGKAPTFDPEGWERIKGSARLPARGRAVLRELYLWREAQAERRDLPPFKVLGPRTMLQIAEHPPTDAKHPGDLRALGPRERQRHGRAVLAALRAGLAAADRGEIPQRRRAPKPTPREAQEARRQRKLSERLKAWRREEATRRKVPNVVVLPNPALEWLAREAPERTEDLAGCLDLGPKRAQRYGRRIMDVLAGRKSKDQDA